MHRPKSRWLLKAGRICQAGMLLLGLAILGVLLGHISLRELWSVLREAAPVLLALAVFSGLVATFFRTLRYGLFFRPAGRWLQLYAVFSVLRVMSLLMPVRSGELVFLALLKKYQFAQSIAKVIPVWILLRAVDLGGLALLLSFAIAFHRFAPQFKAAQWGLVTMAGLAFLLLFGLSVWLGRRGTLNRTGWFGHRLHALSEGLSLIQSPMAWGRTLALSVFIWAGTLGFGTFVQKALGTPLALSECAAVAIITLALSLLPIHAPMGIGTGEAAWTFAMTLLGVPTELAIVLAIAVRLCTLVVSVVEGGLGAALLLVLVNRRNASANAAKLSGEIDVSESDR